MKMLEVGCPAPRFDARAKVTGEEKYAGDHSREDIIWPVLKEPASRAA